MTLAVLVTLICLSAQPSPLAITVVRHLEDNVEWNSAQCDHCPCWSQVPSCAVTPPGCFGPCGYFDTPQWGSYMMTDANGCFDADLLPVPQSGWVYWLTAP